MTTATLTADLGVTRMTLLRWVRAGLVPAPTRVGRERHYSPAAIRAARSLVEAAR